MNLLKSLLLVGVVFGLGVGCATTKQVVPMPDQSKSVSDSKSRIYVLRATGIVGGAMPVTVWDSGKKVGSLGPSGYVCWERDPGEAMIRAMLPGSVVASWPITCEKGQSYYSKFELNMGPGRGILTPMSQSEWVEKMPRTKPPKVLYREP